MATISSGSVTVKIQPGEQYRVIASGEAYVDIGGGSTQSYRLINGSSEKLLGGFIVATPVTIRVVSGMVSYNEINNPINNGLTSLQIDAGATGVAGTDDAGNLIDADGLPISVGPVLSYPRKWPTLTSRKWGVIGDSRHDIDETLNSSSVTNTGIYSPAFYIQQGSEHRGDFSAVHAVNGCTITDILTGYSAAAGQLNSKNRANIRASVLAGVKIWHILVGVNNSGFSDSELTSYRTLIANLITDGSELIILWDELPSNNGSAGSTGEQNLSRSKRLRKMAESFGGNKVVVYNSYEVAGINDLNSVFGKPGYYSSADLLHPQVAGNRPIGIGAGEIMGAALEQSGFLSQSLLPAFDGDSNFLFSNYWTGTSGSIGAGNSGQLATGWTGPSGNGFVHTFSKGMDELGNVTQLWRIQGTSTAAANTCGSINLNRFGLSVSGITQSSNILSATRARLVDATNTDGFMGFGAAAINISSSDGNGNKTFGTNVAGTFTPRPDTTWGVYNFDWRMQSHKTVPPGPNWDGSATSKSLSASFGIGVIGQRSIDITIEFSRGGMRIL